VGKNWLDQFAARAGLGWCVTPVLFYDPFVALIHPIANPLLNRQKLIAEWNKNTEPMAGEFLEGFMGKGFKYY